MAETPTPLSLSRSSLLSRLTLNSLGSFSLSKPKLHSSTANHHDQRWWSKAPSFWSVCLEIWVWVWISKVGFLLGMAKSQRCLCFDLGFVSSVYFQGGVLRTFQNELTGLCGRVCMSCVHVWPR